MKNSNKDIVQFGLSPLAKAGSVIKNMQSNDSELQHDYSKPHRDDHYLLIMITDGQFKLNLDFEEFEITGPTLLFIFPGQVHHIIDIQKPKGWVISFDNAIIDNELQLIFEKSIHTPIILAPQTSFYHQASALMNLIENLQTEISNAYSGRTKSSLIDALLSLIAGQITSSTAHQAKPSRGIIIEQTFRQLLKQHYKDWKQPALYAAALNITVAHLYDTVKLITGYSVSAMIQSYSILEAKRLLWFTNLSVKEIAYASGYEEPVYFGKLLKKTTGLTPLKFRQQYHD